MAARDLLAGSSQESRDLLAGSSQQSRDLLAGSSRWHRVCRLSDVDDRTPVHVEVAGVPVVLVRDGVALHALRDECSHAEVPLSEGELTRKGLQCVLHGSCFDLRTGTPRSLPATEKVDVFAVALHDGQVYVDPTTPVNE